LAWLDEVLVPFSLAPNDVQATLAAFTVHTIAHSLEDSGVDEVFACGGGALNDALMAQLGQEVPTAQLARTDALGIEAMQVEAAAFAWFAHENWLRRHGERTGGEIVRAAYFEAARA
jgi:anhydro-N-acetylmuramic acid kinase